MTETQTTCPDCGGTGFIPPFMDLCPCGAAKLIDFTGTPAGLPPLTSVPPFSAEIADAKVAEELADIDLDEMVAAAEDADEAAQYAAAAADVDAADAEFAYPDDDEIDDEDIAGTYKPITVATVEAAEWITTATTSGAVTSFTKKTPKPATESQKALLARLIAERDIGNLAVAAAAAAAATALTARQASGLIDGLMAVPADPTKKAARPNKYDGVCQNCGGAVPAGEGHISKDDASGRWKTRHKDGECLSVTAKAAMDADKVTEPGLYKLVSDSGTVSIYRVRKSRSSARLYAEKVIIHDHDGDKTVDFAYNANAIAWLRKSGKLTWAEARAFGAAYGSCIACGRLLSDARSLVQGYGATCAKTHGWPTVTARQAEAIIDGSMTWEEVVGLTV